MAPAPPPPESPTSKATMPAYPLPNPETRSAAPTPPDPSPLREMAQATSDLGELKVSGTRGLNDTTDQKAIEETPPKTPCGNASALENDGKIQPNADDDVFGDTATASKAEPPSVPTGPAPGSVADRTTNNPETALVSTSFAPRPDRMNQAPSAANAQGLYLPDALLFVANLADRQTLHQLKASCHQVFDPFGPCHINLHYDRNRHPFAFVQFEDAAHADSAFHGLPNTMLDGRKIRIERAKAERAVILSNRNGSIVTEAEARRVLERYGPIELCVPASTIPRTRHGLTQGVFVKYAFFLDCRDALHLFNNHNSQYVLHLAPSLRPRIRQGPNGAPVVRGFATPRSTIDQKSIYVGNLPQGATREEVMGLFQEFGIVLQANIINKHFDGGVNTFAFLEFDSLHAADRAAVADRFLHGTKLRVEPKEYSSRHVQRCMHAGVTTPAHHRTPRAPGSGGSFGNRPGYGAAPMYPMNTPPTGFGRAPMPSFPPLHHTPFATPSLNRMVPGGIFTPTPLHGMASFNMNPYTSPMYEGMMGPVHERGDEHY